MPDKPSISTRKWIRRGDNPPSEPSNVLVLTSSQKNYTDVRLPFPSCAVGPNKTLDWAFAGTSSSTPAADTKPAHTVWRHWIDSETIDAEEVRDEGDMVMQENGDVLEYGYSVNGEGKEESYVECWVERDVGVVGEEVEKRSWVLRAEDQGKGIRGLVVRVGECVQGVLRRGEEFSVARWWWGWSDGEHKGWENVAMKGGLVLPRELFGEVKIREGDKFTGNDRVVWECVEEYSWI